MLIRDAMLLLWCFGVSKSAPRVIARAWIRTPWLPQLLTTNRYSHNNPAQWHIRLWRGARCATPDVSLRRSIRSAVVRLRMSPLCREIGTSTIVPRGVVQQRKPEPVRVATVTLG